MISRELINPHGIVYGVLFYVIGNITLSCIAIILIIKPIDFSIYNIDLLLNDINHSPETQKALMVINLLSAFIMGIISERRSTQRSITNALICGSLLLVFNVASLIYSPPPAVGIKQLISLGGFFPMALLGGWFVSNRNYLKINKF